MKPNKSVILKKLFFSTLYLSFFTFGGGYVIITLLKNKFVDQYHWLEENEVLDLVAIAQSSPGAIAVNGAIVIGYKLGGIPGVIVSVLGSIIPPMLILSIISIVYDFFINNPYITSILHGMKSGVGAIIISNVYDMSHSIIVKRNYVQILIIFLTFVLNFFYEVNSIYLILAVIIIGSILTLYSERRSKEL